MRFLVSAVLAAACASCVAVTSPDRQGPGRLAVSRGTALGQVPVIEGMACSWSGSSLEFSSRLKHREPGTTPRLSYEAGGWTFQALVDTGGGSGFLGPYDLVVRGTEERAGWCPVRALGPPDGEGSGGFGPVVGTAFVDAANGRFRLSVPAATGGVSWVLYAYAVVPSELDGSPTCGESVSVSGAVEPAGVARK